MRRLACAMVLAAGLSGPATADTSSNRADAEATAHLLATLLDAGRIVVDRNQALIDDPHKGEKGFTAEAFERQLAREFQARTGIDLHRLHDAAIPTTAKELLPRLVEAGKAVVEDAQIVINQRGVGYKNFIPATFGSQAAARFSHRSSVTLKQTTLRPRNPKNQPDDYEVQALRRLGAQKAPSGAVSEVADGGRTLRMVTPLYYDKDCLVCHGEPAGEEDMSGYPKEGAREGELAGAISVKIPLKSR